MRKRRRSGGLAALVAAAAAIALAGCGGSKAPSAASTEGTTASARSPGSRNPAAGGARSATSLRKNGKATRLVNEWAACERSHGDSKQTDPTIDSHGVINITYPRTVIRPGVSRFMTGGPETATGTCSTYLAAAQGALRATHPVRDRKGPDQATYLKYVRCMRTNGVPRFPYPEPNDPTKTDFAGTGVNPNSPSVVRVNHLCGKKLALPTWWINGWGPPGDVSVRAAGVPKDPPACFFKQHGCRNRFLVPSKNY